MIYDHVLDQIFYTAAMTTKRRALLALEVDEIKTAAKTNDMPINVEIDVDEIDKDKEMLPFKPK